MIDTIKVNSGVEESIHYLKGELIKQNLKKDIAVLYLQYLIDESDNYRIVRPIKSYSLPDFGNYLRFYKRYNLLFPLISSNTFSVSDELMGDLQNYELTDDVAISTLNDFL